MLRAFSGLKFKDIILLVVVLQLISTSCSKKSYPVASFRNLESRSEIKQLRVFFDGGTEKKIVVHNITADEIILTARKYLGVPHCMGGTTMKCIDCSGLVYSVFAKYGIHLPHNSQEQARFGKRIEKAENLRKGDLVFFIRSYDTHDFITHTGIYLGDNQFIHTSSKKGVTITSLTDPWWKEKFIFGTRILNP
jgi:murein DD-endopeptidase / murein LD-carboxypeptidase